MTRAHPCVADPARLEGFLRAFDLSGRTPSGLDRLALSPGEEAAHATFARLAREHGFAVTRDELGNSRARLGDPDDDRPPAMTGSHLDAVPDGGSFDGVAGVACGLEALLTLREHCATSLTRPIEVVAFVGEESSRFGVATLGSGLVTGQLDAGHALGSSDVAGVTVAEALRAIGRDPERAASTRWDGRAANAFIEIHIEQGPHLVNQGIDLGIVTHAVGHDRLLVTIEGSARHSGATPMGARHDALCAAAGVVLEVERAGRRGEERGIVATVTVLNVEPNVMNVVPGRAELRIDLRGPDDAYRSAVVTDVMASMKALAADRGVEIQATTTSHLTAIGFAPSITRLLEQAAAQLGYPATTLHSAAGHDAVNMASLVPSAMLFVPSIDGISHHRDEATPLTSLARATEVLALTLAELAGR